MVNVMKNAKDFGFLPGADASENVLALQNAVKGGGEIAVTQPGIYDLDGTVVLESHTALRFGEGVTVRRIKNEHPGGYVFVNKGAFTREYDTDISVSGLHLLCNGVDISGGATAITGLRGHVSFFYIKDLVIRDFVCPDLLASGFAIHICTFENILVENVNIEGKKDGVHLGRGKDFIIRHGRFRTFDDPIALNAHDYATSNPQLGWIENGLIEDCYDLDEETTTGFFCRILAGSWCDWREGMVVQHSDTVVNNGRLYRVIAKPDGEVYTSLTPPTHENGTLEYDGIRWCMVQEDVIYNCGCRNIVFKDIHLCKHRGAALSIHFDDDKWSRSVYPGSEMPVQENIVFDNLYVENTIDTLLSTVTPARGVVFRSCKLKDAKFSFHSLRREGLTYPKASLSFENNIFEGEPACRIYNSPNRRVEFSSCGSELANGGYFVLGDGVGVLSCDAEIVK